MELCKIQEKDYSYVESLLTEAFPPNERPPFPGLIEKADKGLADFWVIREEDRNIIDLPFKLKGKDMVFAVMSNTDTIGPEKCRSVIEGIMGAPVNNFEIVPR